MFIQISTTEANHPLTELRVQEVELFYGGGSYQFFTKKCYSNGYFHSTFYAVG